MSLKHPYSSPSSSPNKRVKTTPPSRDIRHLTPTTSTAAFSSSPRHIDTSPPRQHTKRTRSSDISITVQPHTTLIFGRHRHHRTDHPGTTQIPHHLTHRLDYPTRECETIHLPESARHASRIHAIVETGERSRVVVIGQNGVRVKVDGKWARVSAGESTHVDGKVEIDFYGVKVRMEVESSPFSSPPPSSPPVMAELEGEWEGSEEEVVEEEVAEEEREETGKAEEKTIKEESVNTEESELRPVEEGARNIEETEEKVFEEVEKTEEIEEKAVEEHIPKAEKPITQKKPKKKRTLPISHPCPDPKGINAEIRALLCTKEDIPAPPGIDIIALMASTVVFSGSTKLSLPDIVKHMLEAQPSLRVHGNERDWAKWCFDLLEVERMFVKVYRDGRDSSGHPLLPHYFYYAEADPDVARARSLGGLMRPVRNVQRGGGKAIDWRPVGSARRRY